MGKKVHGEFLEKCTEARKQLEGGTNVAWYAGWNFGTYVNVKFPPPDCDFKFPTNFFAIPVYAEFDLADNILELRDENGSMATIEIPQLLPYEFPPLSWQERVKFWLISTWIAFLDYVAPYSEESLSHKKFANTIKFLSREVGAPPEPNPTITPTTMKRNQGDHFGDRAGGGRIGAR